MAKKARRRRSKARRPKLNKRQRAARKAVRTRRRNQAMRSRRARKANRTRVRRHGKGTKFGAAKEPKKRRRSRRRRRHAAEEAAEPKKRTRRRRRNRAAAPKGYRKSRRTGRWYKARKRSSRRRAAPKRRKSAKRSAAARKGARTRRLRRAKTSDMAPHDSHYVHERRRGRRRGSRRRSGGGRHLARMPNPISGAMDFGAALLGVMVGGLATVFADRFFGATHALTVNGTNLVDSPDKTQNQVYNGVGPQAPIWNSPKRLAAAGGSVVVPFVAAKMVRSPGARSFLQLWGFAALTVTAVKLATDVAAKTLGSKTLLSGLFPRLLAPEIDAANAADYAKTGAALAPYTLVAGGAGPGTTYGVSGTSKTFGMSLTSSSVIPPGPHGPGRSGGFNPNPLPTGGNDEQNTPTGPGRLVTERIPPQNGGPPVTQSSPPLSVSTPSDPATADDPPAHEDPDPWACPPYRPMEPGLDS